MSKIKPAAVVSPVSPPETHEFFELRDQLGKLSFSALPKVALLIKWCEAESTADDWGGNDRLDKLAWLGAEELLRDVLHDVETVMKSSGLQASFVTLADEKDGEE